MEINPKLVPGSVWSLSSGALSTVLAVSNAALPEHMLEKFPRQVVYVNSKNEINTQGVDAFLRKREFVEMDELIAQLMLGITDPEIEEEGEDFDIDSVDLSAEGDGDGGADAMEDLVGGTEHEEEADGQLPVFFPPQVGGVDLDSSFISYAELPGDADSRTHVLRFALGDGLTVDLLKSLFNAESGEIEKFVVDSEAERVEVTPSDFHGVFVEVDSAASGIAAVYLSSAIEATQLTGEALDAAIADLQQTTVLAGTPVTITPVITSESQAQPAATQAGAPTHVIPQIKPVAASVVVN